MLEDQILKKNIPGRYSSWEGNNDDLREEEEEEEVNTCAETLNETQLGTIRSGNDKNTGVKGVLADYKESKRINGRKQEIERLEKKHALDRHLNGAQLKVGELSISSNAIEERKRREAHKNDDESSDESSDDSDDDFLSSYRQKRLLQLQNCANWPSFGELIDVTPVQFSEIIDKTDPRVHVIIHLYESFIPLCKMLDSHLRQLAPIMDYCRFLRLEASSFKSMDPIGLPSILIYKGGKIEANLTPVMDYISCYPRDRFTVEDVRQVLESHEVHDPHSCV